MVCVPDSDEKELSIEYWNLTIAINVLSYGETYKIYSFLDFTSD